MATSGTYNFSPTIQEIIDDAFERCLVTPEKITARHNVSARFSLNLLLSVWAADSINQWSIEQRTQTLTADDPSYALDTRTYDIYDMVLRRDGIDTPVTAYSRDEYLTLPDKTITGRPDRFFLDREISTPTIYLWPAPENSTDQIIYYQLRFFQDVTAGSETPDVRREWIEALIAGLAEKLAEKYAPEHEDKLALKAGKALDMAKIAGRDRSPTTLRPPSRMARRR